MIWNLKAKPLLELPKSVSSAPLSRNVYVIYHLYIGSSLQDVFKHTCKKSEERPIYIDL